MGVREQVRTRIAASRFPLVSFGAFIVVLGTGELADLAGLRHLALLVWTLAILPFAVSFYRLRRRNRLVYGVLELIIAIGFFYFLLVGMAFADKPMTLELLFSRMLTMFAGIYFMVRGLDSIGEGLKKSPWQAKWERFFFGPEKQGEKA